MMNCQLGDCTCAAAGHLIQCWTANAGRMVVPADTAILRAYESVSGYNPGDPSTDNGAVELDVLKFWRKAGIAGHTIGAFAAVEPSSVLHIKQAVWLLEGLYIGLSLPATAQQPGVWDVADPSLAGDGAPGSWGGHAVPVVAYNTDGLTCVTWGTLQRMTWAFWNAYCDEAYGLISMDMLNGQGLTPEGLDLDQLRADLAAVKG